MVSDILSTRRSRAMIGRRTAFTFPHRRFTATSSPPCLFLTEAARSSKAFICQSHIGFAPHSAFCFLLSALCSLYLQSLQFSIKNRSAAISKHGCQGTTKFQIAGGAGEGRERSWSRSVQLIAVRVNQP